MSDDYTATITFDASPSEVFAALTTPEGLAGWWTDVAPESQPGSELTFTFGNPEPLRMRVDEARADLVQWTCLSYRPMPDWVGTVLRFALSEAPGGGCELAFRQEGLTPQLECFDGCSLSWNHFILTSLRNYVERGVGDPRGSAADLAWRAARAAAVAPVAAG